MKTANVSRDKTWWLLFTLGVVPRAPIKSLFPSSVCSDYQSPAQQWTLEGGRERERESERDREGGGEEEGKVQLNNLKLKIKKSHFLVSKRTRDHLVVDLTWWYSIHWAGSEWVQMWRAESGFQSDSALPDVWAISSGVDSPLTTVGKMLLSGSRRSRDWLLHSVCCSALTLQTCSDGGGDRDSHQGRGKMKKLN